MLQSYISFFEARGALKAPANAQETMIHLENNITLPISLETATWLRNHATVLQEMKKNLGDNNAAEIHLPSVTSEQCLTLDKLIKDKYDVPFLKLCKKPTIKKLIDVLRVADFLEITELQKSVVAEVASRYYIYPSLAKRHTSNKLPAKYAPCFTTTIETAVAQKNF